MNRKLAGKRIALRAGKSEGEKPINDCTPELVEGRKKNDRERYLQPGKGRHSLKLKSTWSCWTTIQLDHPQGRDRGLMDGDLLGSVGGREDRWEGA
eukprot:173553-Hanusia_phi.AAC.6